MHGGGTLRDAADAFQLKAFNDIHFIVALLQGRFHQQGGILHIVRRGTQEAPDPPVSGILMFSELADHPQQPPVIVQAFNCPLGKIAVIHSAYRSLRKIFRSAQLPDRDAGQADIVQCAAALIQGPFQENFLIRHLPGGSFPQAMHQAGVFSKRLQVFLVCDMLQRLFTDIVRRQFVGILIRKLLQNSLVRDLPGRRGAHPVIFGFIPDNLHQQRLVCKAGSSSPAHFEIRIMKRKLRKELLIPDGVYQQAPGR